MNAISIREAEHIAVEARNQYISGLITMELALEQVEQNAILLLDKARRGHRYQAMCTKLIQYNRIQLFQTRRDLQQF